jgi:hypothetical protein
VEQGAVIAKPSRKPPTPLPPERPERARKPEWDTVATKIVARDWVDLREIWLANPAGATTFSATAVEPAASLASFKAAIAPYAADKVNVQPQEHAAIAGLHGAVLLESLFLFNKAVHVLSAAQVHIDAGMCSWSLSSAYQSAFFAMKASLALLGVTVAEVESNTYVVDLCTESVTARRTAKYSPPKIIRVMKTQRIEHRQYWGLFQRTLRVLALSSELVGEDLRHALSALDINDFASQRNTLHYGNTRWVFNDLQQLIVQDDFAANAAAIRNGEALSVDRNDFSVALAITLVGCGYRLLADLATVSNAIGEELDVVRRWFRETPSNRYLAVHPQHAA